MKCKTINKVIQEEPNDIGRDFVIGDIHGCYNDFNLILEKLNFDKTKDRMFSVGDLIDRGENSIDCLELMYEPWFYPVIGNHEEMMLYAWESKDMAACWLGNGGAWIGMVEDNEYAKYRAALSKIPFIIAIVGAGKERYNIAHAEILRNKQHEFASDEDIDNWNFTDREEAVMLWGRTIITNPTKYLQEKKVWMEKNNIKVDPLSTTIVGHSAIYDFQKIGSHIFTDLGGVFYYKGDKRCSLGIIQLNYESKYKCTYYKFHLSTKELEEVKCP